MKHIEWTAPITVTFRQGVIERISGPSEALRCLSDHWPDQRGPFYISARSLCRAAMAGRQPTEKAREQFIAAAQEANLNVH